MLLVGDVHGATRALRRLAERGERLVVLGDLINFIDYRSFDGILAELVGKPQVAELVALRSAGEVAELRSRWAEIRRGQEETMAARQRALMEAAYADVCAALSGTRALVTFGNVDTPELLRAALPADCRLIDGEVEEVEGWRVGFVGGGVKTGLDIPGEVSEAELEAKLAGLGEVDVLCTHVPPAVGPLARDVLGGRQKGSEAVLAYLLKQRPAFHYFGDIHQPQASEWRVGATLARNVGYFRATGRGVRLPARGSV